MKDQRANNASVEKERRNYLSSLFSGTSNTKRRRLYQEFGYPVELTFEDFFRAYTRNAIAGASVSRMVDGCWEDFPEIYEGDETKDATKQTAWDKRVNKLLKRCWKQIKGADRRNLVGRYSALLIQVKDSKPWRDPVDTTVVARLAEKALVKLIPAWEAQIEPIEWDSDENSETFGDVKMYSFTEISVGMQTGERASTEDGKSWAKTRMSRRNGFLADVITDLVSRFWTLGIVPAPATGEISVGWSDLLAPSQSEKIANMNAMADVAVKTTNAFGRSGINPNEVRAQGELQPDPELENTDDNEPPAKRADPLGGNNDEPETKDSGDTKVTS